MPSKFSANYINNSVEAQLAATIDLLLGTPPETLDTFQELAEAINSDPLFYQKTFSKTLNNAAIANGFVVKYDAETDTIIWVDVNTLLGSVGLTQSQILARTLGR